MLHIWYLKLFNGRCCYNCGVCLFTSIIHLDHISTLVLLFSQVIIRKLDINGILFCSFLQILNQVKKKATHIQRKES